MIVTIDNRNAKYGDQRLFKEKILKKLETNHFSFFSIVWIEERKKRGDE